MAEPDKQEAVLDPRVYDRQLRVWGVAAQKRLSSARVLVSGTTGLASELCKDLVLAGIGTLHLHDRHPEVPLSAADLTANCLIGPNKIGSSRVQAFIERLKAMNPLVTIQAANSAVLTSDEHALEQYDLILALGLTHNELLALNARTRRAQVPLIGAQVLGQFGYALADLLAYQYTRKVPGKDTEETHAIAFPSYEHVLQGHTRGTHRLFIATTVLLRYLDSHALPRSEAEYAALVEAKNSLLAARGLDAALVSDEYQRTVAQHAAAELAPVCALLGGVVAQEAIKLLTRVDEPLRNVFLYDGGTGEGLVEAVGL